mgnify:CR=1 FL=1
MSSGLFDLDGRIALVTGATHGLGMAMAMGLGEAGATLVVNGHSSDQKIADAVDQYRNKGIQAHGYRFNVTDEAAVEAAVERIETDVGPIDILVNNAGIIKRVPLLDMSTEDFEEVIRTDLTGVFVMSRRVVRSRVNRGGGIVLNL